jgi:hypothetical protein
MRSVFQGGGHGEGGTHAESRTRVGFWYWCRFSDGQVLLFMAEPPVRRARNQGERALTPRDREEGRCPHVASTELVPEFADGNRFFPTNCQGMGLGPVGPGRVSEWSRIWTRSRAVQFTPRRSGRSRSRSRSASTRRRTHKSASVIGGDQGAIACHHVSIPVAELLCIRATVSRAALVSTPAGLRYASR